MTTLAVLLPAGLAAGLAVRAPMPSGGTISSALLGSLEPAGEPPFFRWYQRGLWGELPIYTELVESGDGIVSVILHPVRDLKAPDVLVYWARLPARRGDNLQVERVPEGATLVGSLAGTQPRRYVLPAAASEHNGRLILYSLAHQRVIGVAVLGAD
jgi:hypothetical protein